MWRLDGLRRRFYRRHWKVHGASGWVMHRGGHGALLRSGGGPRPLRERSRTLPTQIISPSATIRALTCDDEPLERRASRRGARTSLERPLMRALQEGKLSLGQASPRIVEVTRQAALTRPSTVRNGDLVPALHPLVRSSRLSRRPATSATWSSPKHSTRTYAASVWRTWPPERAKDRLGLYAWIIWGAASVRKARHPLEPD
jgi:hypothetical protein